MARKYLSKTDMAARLGITLGALNSLRLPKPDVVIGVGDGSPRVVYGWSVRTFEEWNESRPGSGNWKKDKK